MNDKKIDGVESRPAQTPAQDKFELIAKVMLAREERIAREEEQKLVAQKLKDEQRERNAQSNRDQLKFNQANCDHLKGGSGPKNAIPDHNVYKHIYVNGKAVIRCIGCRMAWHEGDTAEFLIDSDGQRIPNHTHMGWFEASQLLKASTNKPSKAEIPFTARPTVSLP